MLVLLRRRAAGEDKIQRKMIDGISLFALAKNTSFASRKHYTRYGDEGIGRRRAWPLLLSLAAASKHARLPLAAMKLLDGADATRSLFEALSRSRHFRASARKAAVTFTAMSAFNLMPLRHHRISNAPTGASGF